MASANQVGLALTREKSFGVIPTSGVEGATPVLQEMRITSEDLRRRTSSTRSQELRADRQTADMIRTDVSSGGSVNAEMSFGGTTFSVISGNIECVQSTSKITGESDAFNGVVAGNWVRFYREGSANNGYWFVTSVSVGNDELTVTGEGTATLEDEDPGSFAEVAVDTAADQLRAAALQGIWTAPFSEAVAGYFGSSGGSDAFLRTAVNDSQTSVFSVNGSAQYARSSGDFTSSFKVGMMILVAGFANPENNGLKTVTAVTTTTLSVSDTLTTETSPAGAVSIKSDWVSLGYSAGQVVKVSGYATASANTFHIVEQVTPTSLVVATNIATESTVSGTVTFKVLSQCVNGVLDPSFSIERSHTDLPTIFEQLTGQKVDTLSMRMATQSIATGSFGFLGKDEDGASATFGTGSNEGATTFDVWNGIDNLELVRENHVAFGTIIRDVSIDVGNNMFPRTALTLLGASSIGSGSNQVRGSMTVYFEDHTVIDKYRNWTTTSFTFIFSDPSNNYFVVHVPSVKLSDASAPTQGLNQDVTASFTWDAFRDASLLETIRFARLQA